MADTVEQSHRIQLVPIGSSARQALGTLLRVFKQGNLLQPVTVVVPHPLAGLATRRALATEPGGLANVRFDILARIADSVAAASLAAEGLAPLNNTILAAGVRHVLAKDPGLTLANVAKHRATEKEVSRFVVTYSQLSVPAREKLAGLSPKYADLVALVERVQAHLAGYYNRQDAIYRAAQLVANQSEHSTDLGEVIVYLPTAVGNSEMHFYEALAKAGRLSLIIGETGNTEADAVVNKLVAQFTPSLAAPIRVEPTLKHANKSAQVSGGGSVGHLGVPPLTVVETSDPDEEVRAALREVVKHWHNGTPLERMALLYPNADPYASLLYHQANAANITIAGAAVSSLRASVAGAVLVGALGLNPAKLVRQNLMNWLYSGPIIYEGQLAPVAQWDLITREAGIVAGSITSWQKKLDQLTPQHQRPAVTSLIGFLKLLDQHLGRLYLHRSWSAFAKASQVLMETFLGTVTTRETNHWPEVQHQAFELVNEALASLGSLDSIEPNPTLATFVSALDGELNTEYGRLANFGNGLLVAPLHHGVGLNLDFVAVLGLAEGTVPTRSTTNVFLNDIVVDEAGLGLPSPAEDTANQNYIFRGAMASAPYALTTTPRGDLRDKRTKLPSRWLLSLVSERTGTRVTSENFLTIDVPPTSGLHLQSVASFSAGLTRSEHHVSVLELNLAELTNWVDKLQPPNTLPDFEKKYPYLVKPLEARTARRDGFNRYTGLVDPQTASLDRVMSATSLEHWAVCPRRYFFAQVLGLAEQETPEEIEEISPADRGSLVHQTLELFYAETIAKGTKPSDEAWNEADHTRLEEIFVTAANSYEEHGLTGYSTLWALTKAAIVADLHFFLDWDSKQRAEMGSTPIAAELRFGFNSAPGLAISIANGNTLHFRGSADRVDRSLLNGQLQVVDYKTGSNTQFKKLNDQDPVLAGTKLQLPVYALAAAKQFGLDKNTQVHSAYWFISNKGGFQKAGYHVTDNVLKHFYAAINSIAEGISNGVFPGVPDPIGAKTVQHDNCRYCDFDRLCRLDRSEEWELVQLDPAVAPYKALSGLELPDDTAVAPTEGGPDGGSA